MHKYFFQQTNVANCMCIEKCIQSNNMILSNTYNKLRHYKSHKNNFLSPFFFVFLFFGLNKEAAWPSGQRIRLAIRWSRVRVPLWPLAGFVLGCPEFKFSATLVNSQLVASCQLGFLILLCCI